MMTSINKMLFGPLDKKYCVLFYAMTVISFALIVIMVINGAYMFITEPKQFTPLNIALFVMVLLHYLFFYIQYRLLNMVCVSK
jgi:hypothetical protein